jgi:hypothetical protein
MFMAINLYSIRRDTEKESGKREGSALCFLYANSPKVKNMFCKSFLLITHTTGEHVERHMEEAEFFLSMREPL